MTDASRQQFEAWCKANYPLVILRRDSDGYVYSPAVLYWDVWQASRKQAAEPVRTSKTIDKSKRINDLETKAVFENYDERDTQQSSVPEQIYQLVAAAAGYTGFVGTDFSSNSYFCIPADLNDWGSVPRLMYWLTDSGDAFDLAMLLGIGICISPGKVEAYSIEHGVSATHTKTQGDVDGNGRAARAAIVECASLIGLGVQREQHRRVTTTRS